MSDGYHIPMDAEKAAYVIGSDPTTTKETPGSRLVGEIDRLREEAASVLDGARTIEGKLLGDAPPEPALEPGPDASAGLLGRAASDVCRARSILGEIGDIVRRLEGAL